ncbi:sugar ABC transporter substrate-binding protein [Bacillus sp. IITD106]|nr:sugar ABC transporter substrate-binding protein [Bacillus sp. IITD106]
MKKVRNGFLVFFLSVFLLVTGCSSNSSNAGGKSDKGGETIELSFMGHGNPDEKKIFQSVIKSFEEKYPNVKVKYTSVPPAEYSQKLSTLIGSGKQPDVYYAAGPEFARFVAADQLLNLQSYLDQTDIFNPDNVWKQALDRYRYDGTTVGGGDLYGLPKDVGPWAMAYNKDLFDEAGVEYPPLEIGKWTWNDMLEAATKLTKDTNGDGKVDQYGIAGFPLETAVWGNGADYIDYETGEVKIDSPEFIEAMQFVADLSQKHKVSPSKDDEKAQNNYTRFVSGGVGMFPMGPWDQPSFWELPFGWDLAPWPASPNTGETATWLGSMGFVISKKTKHPEEAFALASYLSLDEDGQRQFMELGQQVPNLISLAENEFLNMDKAPENRQEFINIIEDYGRPNNGWRSPDVQWLDYFNQESAKVWTGEMSVEDWVKQAKPKMEELYKKGNLK